MNTSQSPLSMTTKDNLSVSPATNSIAPNLAFPTTENTWDAVRYWVGMSTRFKQADLACQVMAGFALRALYKQHGVGRGRRVKANHSATPNQIPNDSVFDHNGQSWPEIVKAEAGVSDDTARNWMSMSDGIKSRWKKLPVRDRLRSLMEVSPSQWSDDDTKLITDAVHKSTDGRTQLELMWDLGIAKKPSGNPHAKGTGQPSKNLTAEEQATLLREMALEDSGRLGHAITASNKNFFLLTEVNDLEVTAQVAVLEHALKLRHAWIDLPKSKRDPQALESLLSFDPLSTTRQQTHQEALNRWQKNVASEYPEALTSPDPSPDPGTPTGFHHSAQGCEARATLGSSPDTSPINPEKVASPEKPFGWEVTVRFHPGSGKPDKTFHYVSPHASTARKKALMNRNAQSVIATEPVTKEQWFRASGDPRQRM